MRRLTMASIAFGLVASSSLADDVRPVSVAETADACFLAIDDFDAALSRLEVLGWIHALPAQIDVVARAVAEFGHLGGLRAAPDAITYDPSDLPNRIDQITRDIPDTTSRILNDFPGETFIDREKQGAILTTSDGERFVVLNMKTPMKVCAVLFSADVSEPSHSNDTLLGIEDALQRYFPDHTRWSEAHGAAGPMLAIDFHGYQDASDAPYPRAFYYSLHPGRIAEHTGFSFWMGQVFTFFLQDL